MKKKNSAPKQSNSLKTFYLYTAVVITIIFVSLIMKLVFVFLESKFDGAHHFTLAVVKEGHVKEIYAFSPQIPSLAVLEVTDAQISAASLGKQYGIVPDAQLTVGKNGIVNDDPGTVLWSALMHFPSIKTDGTIVDLFRLTILSKNIATTNKVIRQISLHDETSENNTIIARALNDPTLSSENVSIQIINASDVSGLGQRLGRVLTNLGANVVEVSTAQTPEANSKIQYYGEKTYTLDEIKKMTGYQLSEVTREPIANIVITLGTDSVKKAKF